MYLGYHKSFCGAIPNIFGGMTTYCKWLLTRYILLKVILQCFTVGYQSTLLNYLLFSKDLTLKKIPRGSKISVDVDNSRNIKMGSSIKNLDFLERQ